MLAQAKALLKLVIAPAIAAITALYTADEVVTYLATVAGIATLAPVIIEPIKQWIGTSGWYTRILSAVVVYALLGASWWLAFGLEVYSLLTLGIGGALVTLSTWGVVSIEQVKALLAVIFNDNE